jgi:hypothetical protein
MNAHKGLSVRVFKASTLASNSYAAPAKLDVGYRSMSMSSSDSRTAQGDEYFSDVDTNRKALVRADVTKRSSLYSNPSSADPPIYERRRSSANYEIRPSTTQGTYFYERSISSKSDNYPSSDSSNTDADSICDSPSSVTTNLSTAISIGTTTAFQSMELTVRPSKSSSPSSSAAESFPIHISTLNRTHDSMSSSDDEVEPLHYSPLVFPEKTQPRRLRTPPTSESSDDTVVSGDKSTMQERAVRPRVMSRSKGQRDFTGVSSVLTNQYPSGKIESAGSALQVRFDSEVQEIPESRYAMPFSSSTRKDVGDQFDAQTPYLPHPPGLERYSHSQQGTPVHHIPRRRGSDGDQTINMPSVSTNPPFVEHLRSSSAPPARSVRWNENLICPSPILASQRRQGWFNRRG